MKAFKCLIVLLGVCLPFALHAQVVRISGNANIVVTGDAKLVLHDGNLVQGSIGANATPVIVTGYYDKGSLQASRNAPVSNNVLVDKSYGNTWATNDNTYIFLGQELAIKKPVSIQTFMQAWPNPTIDRITVAVNSDKATTGVIALQDASGQVLERRQVSYAAGLNTIQWRMDKYATGTYLLVFENAPGRYIKVIKQ